MNKIQIIAILILLLAVNLYQIQRYKQLKVAYRVSLTAPSVNYGNNNKVKQMIADELCPIDIAKVEPEDGDATLLNDLLSTPKLILRVSEFNCGACVDSTLLLLHKYAPQLKDKVVILANITNGRNRIVFKRVHGLNDYPFYYLNEHSMPLRAEKRPIG